jgi:hypothetical protein
MLTTCQFCHHVELSIYVECTPIIITLRKTARLISYVEVHPIDLEGWLRERKIDINGSMSTEILFAQAGSLNQRPRQVLFLGKPNSWADIDCYLGLTFGTRLPRSSQVDQFRKRAVKSLGVLNSLLNRRSDLSIGIVVLVYKQPIRRKTCPVWRLAVSCSLLR